MKSMNECISDIQKKAEKKIAEQNRRRRMFLSITSSFACLVLVMVSVFTIPSILKGNVPVQPDIDTVEPGGNTNPPSNDANTSNTPTNTPDDRIKGPVCFGDGSCAIKDSDDLVNSACIFYKYEKCVCACLNSALDNNAEDTVFAIRAFYRPATANISSFTYNGKTLSDIALAAYAEQSMPETMAMFLKAGESLKYGEALYTTGTPDGEKWTKEHYDEVIAFFGQDLLDRYIVDGKFLRTDLENDIENYNESAAQTEYKKAFDAYLKTVYEKTIVQLKDSNIKCEVDSTRVYLILYATRDEFEKLTISDQGNWYFDLATQDGNENPGDLVPSDDAVIKGN